MPDGPWTKYQTQAAPDGPWTKYQTPAQPPPEVLEGVATGPRRPVLAKMVRETGTPTKYGFKVSEEADINVGNTRGRFVVREDGAIWNGQKWVDPDTGMDAGDTPGKEFPDEWNQGEFMGGGGSKTVNRRESTPDEEYLRSKGVDVDNQWGPGFVKKIGMRHLARSRRAGESPSAFLKEVARGVSDIPLTPSLGGAVRTVRGLFTDEPLGVESVLPDSTIGRTGYGALVKGPLGIAQGLNTLAGTPESSRLMNEFAGSVESGFNEYMAPSQMSELAGEALPFLATGGGGAAVSAPSRAARLLGYAKNLAGGVAGSAAQMDPAAVTQEQARASMAERAQMGGGLAAVLPPVAKLAGKAYGAAADSGAGVYLAQKAEGTPLEFLLGKTKYKPGMEEAANRMQDLRKLGVRSTVGDVTGDPRIRAQEDFFRATNDPMSDFRLDQNRDVRGLAQSAKKRVSDEAASIDWDNIDEIREIAKFRGERGNQAREILKQMEGKDGNGLIPMREVPGGVESISARSQLVRAKARADRRFGRIERDAAGLGKAQNEAVALKKTAREILDNLRDDTGDTVSVKNYVKNIVAGLEKATTPRDTPTRAKLLSAIGAPSESVPGPAQDITFSGLRKLRSEINKKIQSLKGSAVAPDETALVELGRLGKSVEDAMDGFLSRMAQNPNNPTAKRLSADYKTAQKLYKDAVAPYKDTDFGRKLSDASPKGIVDLFANADVADQQRFMKLMGEKGRAAVRARLISGALGAGEVPKKGMKGIEFDPNKAAAKLRDLLGKGDEKHAEVVLGPKLSGAMEGLHNVLVTLGRSADDSVIPEVALAKRIYPTGTSIKHGALMWLQNKITGGPTLEGFTSPRSYLLLQRARKAKPGSREMWGLIALLTDEMDSDPPKKRRRDR